MENKIENLVRQNAALTQLVFESEKEKKGQAKKQTDKGNLIEEHIARLPVIFTKELFVAVLSRFLNALWGNVFKSVAFESYFKHTANMLSVLFFLAYRRR